MTNPLLFFCICVNHSTLDINPAFASPRCQIICHKHRTFVRDYVILIMFPSIWDVTTDYGYTARCLLVALIGTLQMVHIYVLF